VLKAVLEALEALQKEIFIKNACFSKVQTGFSATQYLRSKADAELDFKATKKSPAAVRNTGGAPKNTPHPGLYIRLKKWREDIAEQHNMILYEVLPTSSLIEIVHLLPLTLPSLKKIKGVGATKSQRFGAELIAIIQEYCTEQNIPSNQLSGFAAEALAVKAPKVDTKTVTFELFKAGKTVEEIALERGFVSSTIEGHLAHFVGLGELDIFQLIEREKVEEIEQFFRNNNTASSAEAKAHFEDKYSYGEIKLVLQHLSLNDAS
jgi:uncharacterized protein YpbB